MSVLDAALPTATSTADARAMALCRRRGLGGVRPPRRAPPRSAGALPGASRRRSRPRRGARPGGVRPALAGRRAVSRGGALRGLPLQHRHPAGEEQRAPPPGAASRAVRRAGSDNSVGSGTRARANLTSRPRPATGCCARRPQAELARAVAELPLAFRAPLVLAALEERPLEEIARLLGLPPATVKTRLFRARERLRVRLQSYWKGAAP